MKTVQPLRVWLAGSHLVVLALPLVAVLGTGALAHDLRNQTREDLEHQAALIALHARERLDTPTQLTGYLHDAKASTLAGIRIVDPTGHVIASSGEGLGEDLSAYPEIRTALAGGEGAQVRPRAAASRGSYVSPQSRHADVRLFVAVPVWGERERVLGAVIISRTPREEVQALVQMLPRLSVGVLGAVVCTIGIALAAGHYASRSLRALSVAFDQIARGTLPGPDAYDTARRSHIAETRALAQAMETMAERLRARLSYISEFAGNVSHEFKTPVSSLRGTIELIRDDEGMPAEQRARFLDNALADLERLSRLVGGLLRLARAEEGGARAPVDLTALLREVAERHDVQVDGGAAVVLGNAEQLEAVFGNLLENARRHGGPHVYVRAACVDPRVEVEVVDDGPGISSANLARIFDRFFTTDRARGGTGLGLALARTVVEAHGGALTVESVPGCTRFRVSLPRVP